MVKNSIIFRCWGLARSFVIFYKSYQSVKKTFGSTISNVPPPPSCIFFLPFKDSLKAMSIKSTHDNVDKCWGKICFKDLTHLLSSQEGIWNVSILFFSKKDIISFGGLIWPWSEHLEVGQIAIVSDCPNPNYMKENWVWIPITQCPLLLRKW